MEIQTERWSTHTNGAIPDTIISGIPEPIIERYRPPRYMAKLTDNGLQIDIKLALAVCVFIFIGGMGACLLGIQFLPFQTRIEAKADSENINYQIAQMGLRLQNDEQRYDGNFERNDKAYGDIQNGLSDIKAQLAALQAVQATRQSGRQR